MASKKATTNEGTPVLVTTEHRGVFFGYLHEGDYDEERKRIRLHGMRNCVYWTADIRGFVGLATHGPVKGCKVGPAAPKATLHNVTAVLEMEPEAVERWTSAPW